MTDFIEAVRQYPFMLNALLMGVLASVAGGVVGTFVVTRRITFIAGSIAHSVLGGMGAARYLSVVKGWEGLHPLMGAVAAALVAAAVIGLVSLRAKEREDTVIGAIWAVGMAVGLVFIAQTPGYSENLMSYLFGNILMVGTTELTLVAGLDLVVLAIAVIFQKQLTAVCFDEEFARVRGVNVEFFYLLLLILTGLTVVILVSVVGLVMVIAMLTLPVAVAGKLTHSLWKMMVAACLASMVFATSGLAISFSSNLPAGATIILVAGAAYLLVLVVLRVWRTARVGQ